jgi:predicted permease
VTLFRLLLLLFPAAFRAAFGEEMGQVFAAQREEARTAGIAATIRLWLRTARGMTTAAWHERRASRGPRRGPIVEWTDLRYTVRRLRATPGFTVAVVATLAVCLGANLTIFAAVHSILLRPLPFPEPDRLVTIYNTYPLAKVMDDGASIANYYERRGRVAAFSSVSLYRDDAVIVGDPGSSEREFVMRVSPEFFTTVGIRPAFGREFTEDETVYGSDRAVILSDTYWKQQYSGDRGVIGRSMRINGTAFTIVGVLPGSFRFLSSRARLFLPLASGQDDRLSSRRHSGSSSHMVARLAAGVTLRDAQAQLDAHDALVERDDPKRQMMADAGYRSLVVSLHGRHVESIRPALLLLQAGALTLLLIGLVNVGNLFLVRAGARTRELAVRRAIGARPSHIVGSVLAETLVLSTVGAGLGLVLASGGVALLGRLGANRLPLGTQITLDGMTMMMGTAAAVAIAFVLGTFIAVQHLRNQAGDALRADTRGGTASPRAQRTRQAVLVAQVALSFALLSSAAMLASGVRALMRVAPGFEAGQLLTAQISLPPSRYRNDAAVQSFLARLHLELGRVPGMATVGVATNIPLSGSTVKAGATIAGRPVAPGQPPRGVYFYAVAGDYFATMRIPLRDGRYLSASETGLAARVCVVDEAFARRNWPQGGAVGQRLFLGGSEGPPEDAFTIIGVVGTVKQASLAESEAIGAVYFPYSGRFDRSIYVVGRATVPPESLIPALRSVVRGLDPELPINNARSMDTRVSDSLVVHRSPAIFAALFSGIALLLCGLGTYGVASYAVAQRRREIGIRMALGARPEHVRSHILMPGLRVLALGLTAGVAGAWAASRWLASALEGLPPAPIGSLTMAAAVMSVVCVVACLLPARRAMRISPVEAITGE